MSGIIQGLLSSFPIAAAGIQYVGGTVAFASANNVTTSLTSLTGGIGSAPIQDDLVIVYVGCSSLASRAFTFSSATYTSIQFLYANGANDANLQVSRRFMTATPDTSITVSHNGLAADTIAVYISVWRGVDQTTPIDVASTTATAANTLIANPPSITPTTSGAYIVAGAIGAAPSGAVQSTGVYTSSDLTEFRSVGGGTGARTSVVGAGYKEWTSGAFDPAVFGISNITDSTNCTFASVTLALRPG
jgi:hypothetical protein